MAINNISTLIPSDINNTLNNIKTPKSFGSQLIDDNKSKLIYSSEGVIKNLKSQINSVIQSLSNLEISHAKNQQDLLLKYSPPPPTKPTLTLEEYQQFSKNENDNYLKEKEQREKEQIVLEERLKVILFDPYKNLKTEDQKIKNRIKRTFQSLKTKKSKEKKRLSSKVLKSQLKTLYPILTLQATKLLTQIVANNQRIQELVNNTNNIIDAAVTQNDINNAIIVRNNTLSIIRDNEKKLESFKKSITQINRILLIFNIIIRLSAIILPLPVPSPSPDIVTRPKERFRKKYENAVKIVEGLNILISIIQGIFDTKLEDLIFIKSQLKNINNLIDNKTSIESLSTQPTPPSFADYKGFKFAIKEETSLGAQQAVVVRGTIKRKYAAAIDRNGVEVLKSEYSFTLDPQDLVEQLKLIIDQQNLQG